MKKILIAISIFMLLICAGCVPPLYPIETGEYYAEGEKENKVLQFFEYRHRTGTDLDLTQRMGDSSGMYPGRAGVRSYPTCCLQPDNPYGYFTQSDTGTGIRNGDELSCHPAMSLHYRLLPVDCIPHQISAVCFCIQSMHQHRNACHFLYQAKFFLV